MRVLYVGPVLPGSTCEQRLRAIRDLGHDVSVIKTTDFSEYRTLRGRICLKLGFALDLEAANDAILDALRRGPFDVCWFDKATTVRPSVLAEASRRAPRAVLASYSPDDMTFRPNRSVRFARCLPLFDVHFTTKEHNVAPLLALGARRVELVGNAYAPEVHRPMPRTPEHRERLGGPVGFIGDFERDRSEAVAFLARNGVPVRVWGPNWSRRLKRPPTALRIEKAGVFGDDYARAISNFDVNLAFLRRSARDRQTTRSIEIPACGGFMLAERTEDHLRLFEEGREAEFFSGPEELLRKCRHYLARPEARQQVAAAGRRRCLESGYSNLERIARMFRLVGALLDGKRGAATL